MTVTFEIEGNISKAAVERFLQRLLWDKDLLNSNNIVMEVMRFKVRHVYVNESE